jgi:hypothetical protein
LPVLKAPSHQAVLMAQAVEAADLVETMVTVMAIATAPDADIDTSTAPLPTAQKSSRRHVTDNV